MCKIWTKLNYAVHPGEILKEYLDDSSMTQIALAKKIGMNKTMLNEILHGKRPITIKTAIKLEKAFSFNAQFWINLQIIYNEAIERLKIKDVEKMILTQINFKNTTEIVEYTTKTSSTYTNLVIDAA